MEEDYKGQICHRSGYKTRCEADDARVCWLIRYGETHPEKNPRCSCACHGGYIAEEE